MVSSGQSKIGELASHSLVGDQYIFRLQIPMVDSNGVAVLNSVQDLKESTFGPVIITNELALLSDVREEITFRAVLDDNVGAVRSVHDLNQRDNVRVRTSLVVELDLSLLKLALARLKANLVKRLHSIRDVGLEIHGGVDNSISTDTEDTSELKPTSKNLT